MGDAMKKVNDDDLQERITENDKGGTLFQRLYAKNEGVRATMDGMFGVKKPSAPSKEEENEDVLDLLIDSLMNEPENSEGKFIQRRRTELPLSPMRMRKTT